MRSAVPLLFLTVVIAWGLTWYAIRLQLGTLPIEVSVFWRFALAATMIGLGLGATRRLRSASWSVHGWLALLGMTLFSANFLMIYASETRLPSGVVSVVFSMATVFTAINRLFLGRRPNGRTLAGAMLGITGVALLFGVSLGTGGSRSWAGVALALGGTSLFSLGNLISARIAASGLDLPNAILRGMIWGVAYLALFALIRGDGFMPPLTASWLGGVAYLSAIGSVVGFLAYLSLALRIGSDRAAYTTVMVPVVALLVSTIFEHYIWTARSGIGLGLILLGNVVIFAPSGLWRRMRPALC